MGKFLASLAALGLTLLLVDGWLGLFPNKNLGYALGFALLFAIGLTHDILKARARGLTVLQYWRLPRGYH